MFRRYLLLFSTLLPIGCTSFNTTVMQRSYDGRFYPNLPCAKTKGIPVKLKVPTHVEVRISETFFIQEQDGVSPNKTFSEARILRPDGTPIRALNVVTNLVYTDKVFTVDFRRPAGGLLNLGGVTMDSQQYFLSINAAYQERTLEQINSVLSGLKTQQTATYSASTSPAGSLTPVAAAENVAKSAQGSVGIDQRIVAMARFDISEENWEERLQAFVEDHLTSCYKSCDIKN